MGVYRKREDWYREWYLCKNSKVNKRTEWFVTVSFYQRKLKKTDWLFEFCFLLPDIYLNREVINKFQTNYRSNKVSLPTNFIVDSSMNKCYIELVLLGFGFSYHFHKVK